MTGTEHVAPAPVSTEEIQQGWHELVLRVGQLEAEKEALHQENKSLRFLLERVIDHRQKSHNELVLIITSLVSKLPLNDLGAIIAGLVEHNTRVTQYLAALIKGTADINLPQPAVLQTLDQAKRDLLGALKPIIDGFIQADPPLDPEMLKSIPTQPEVFFTPAVVRATRCFMKGYVPKDRIVKEFGKESLVFFNDMTTDTKLNPNPRAEEIALAFKSDFETLFQQDPNVLGEKRPALLALYQRVQRSRAATDAARAQKHAFLKMSFILDLLYFYDHRSTEAPDAIFAQRLPGLVEQLVLAGPRDGLDERLIAEAEGLMGFVVVPEFRQMIVNNIGKSGGTGRTLKFVLRLRSDKLPGPELDQEIVDFVKHLVPAQNPPKAEALMPILRLIKPEIQRLFVRCVSRSDRLRRQDADALTTALAAGLDLKGLEEQLKAEETISPEVERQQAWAKIKELISRRSDAASVAAAIRDRLNAKYDGEEIKQSWITLIEADPISLIRVFCQLPYRADGSTDSVARPVMETYISRLTHEKYAATYTKIVNSLKNMYHAKPDSPTLVNFLALVKWVNPEAANKLCSDIGMAVAA